MEFTTSTKCQCLLPDFTPPGNGCRQPDKCLGPGGAGIGDYCEGCSVSSTSSRNSKLLFVTILTYKFTQDSRCRRHAMEAVQKARDLSWRHKTSRRKCKCAHDNIIGCDSPAHCSGFGCGAQGFCQACEVGFPPRQLCYAAHKPYANKSNPFITEQLVHNTVYQHLHILQADLQGDWALYLH
jgi:hypothetical protein